MADCVFCMIANHEIPSNVAYEDDQIICFHDLEPHCAPCQTLASKPQAHRCADCPQAHHPEKAKKRAVAQILENSAPSRK